MMTIDVSRDLASRPKGRGALFKRWLVLWTVAALLILYPINSFLLRLSILGALASLYFGTLHFFWKNKLVRSVVLLISIALIIFLLLPPRRYDKESLRKQYVSSLQSYEGTRYIWGGENWIGIDCSGLVRSSLIKADYLRGFSDFDPGLILAGLDLWLHDCSARALGEEYRKTTRKLFSTKSINQIDHSLLLPGDIAVTDDGIHVLAYLGNEIWIEADPDVKHVITIKVPDKSNLWFEQPVNLMRWAQLDGDSGPAVQ